MAEGGPSDPFCFFCHFHREQSPQKYNPPATTLRLSNVSKMSLKRTPSRPSMVGKHLTTEPSVLSFSKRTSVPLHFSSSRPSQISMQPLTPKPTIRFSWNVDLQQTKKNTQIQEDAPVAPGVGEAELDKTKPIGRKWQHLSSLNNPTKNSLISIADSSPKVPKVEESLIMVDYFNPNTQQLLKLEELLKTKQQQQQ